MEQEWVYSFCIAYRHARNRGKTRGCVAKVVGNRVFSGHTCKKLGKNLQVCGESGRKQGCFLDTHARNRAKTCGCVGKWYSDASDLSDLAGTGNKEVMIIKKEIDCDSQSLSVWCEVKITLRLQLLR